MEKNTVSLSLKDYNELRDFYEKLSSGHVETYDTYGGRAYYITESEALKTIAEENKGLAKQILKLNRQIKGEDKPKDICITDVKKMSIWQFIKWKRNG